MKLYRRFLSFMFGITENEIIERIVKEEYSENKYWKNFSFKGIDIVDFSEQTRKDFSEFIAMPKVHKADFFELALNPAIHNIQFDLDNSFPLTKPTVAFVRTDIRFAVNYVTVRELARVFLKFKTGITGGKTIAEARYLVIDDGKKNVTFETVIVNNDNRIKEKTLVGIFAFATNVYIATQFAFKNRPTVFVDATNGIGDGNGKAVKDNPKRVVPVRRLIINHEEEREFLEGHFTKKMKCTAWGASGRYRHLKDGRVIWVRSYIKGEDRNNPRAYTPKIYDIVYPSGK